MPAASRADEHPDEPPSESLVRALPRFVPAPGLIERYRATRLGASAERSTSGKYPYGPLHAWRPRRRACSPRLDTSPTSDWRACPSPSTFSSVGRDTDELYKFLIRLSFSDTRPCGRPPHVAVSGSRLANRRQVGRFPIRWAVARANTARILPPRVSPRTPRRAAARPRDRAMEWGSVSSAATSRWAPHSKLL